MNVLFQTVTASKKAPKENNISYFPNPRQKDIQHTVFIHDLEIMMNIGIHDHEKTKAQRVIINLEINMNPGNNYDDFINNTVSYDDLLLGITSLASKKHYNLVETLANDIAEFCLSFSMAMWVNINIQKPDVLKNSGSVGFILIREKTAL